MKRWLLPVLIFTGLLATYDYHHNPTGWYDLALFATPATLILAIIVQRTLAPLSPDTPSPVTWHGLTRRQGGVTLFGLICFVLLAQAQSRTPTWIPVMYGAHHAIQFALFVVGVISITWGMTGGCSRQDIIQLLHGIRHERATRWLLALMLLGLIVRGVWLETAVHYYTDETNFASAVTRLRDIPHTQIMNNIGPVANFTWVYPYLQFYYTEVFGATLANLRAVSVLVGVLTIPAIYLLGRWGFNHRIGLLSAVLLTFDLPHIHYSRLALNNIIDPLLGVLTIALLWRGLQTGSRRVMALGGVCLGLTGYFYEGGRLLYPALIVAWLLMYSLLHNGKIRWRPLAVYGLSAFFMMSAFYLSLSLWGFQNITPRLEQQRVQEDFWAEFFTSPDALGQLSRYMDERINPPFLHIVSQPDGSGFYYSRHLSLVLVYALPFFLMGVGVALSQWRGIGWVFPLWVMLTILGNSLIERNDWTARFVVVFPALVMLTALGLDTVYRAIERQLTARVRRTFAIGAISILMTLAGAQIVTYFGVMLPDYNVAIRLEIDDQDAGYRAQFLTPDTQVYILASDDRYHLDVEVMQAYEQHTVRVQVEDVSAFNFDTLPATSSAPLAFFVVQGDSDTLNRLRQLYGAHLKMGAWSPYGSVPRSLQFALYQVAPF